MIVGDYEYERQRVCEHRHIFLLSKNGNSHMVKCKSSKCILVTVMMMMTNEILTDLST